MVTFVGCRWAVAMELNGTDRTVSHTAPLNGGKMSRARRLMVISIALLLSSNLLISGCGSSVPPTAPAGALPSVVHRGSGSSPIQHVIIVIQENRSFDNLFATFPGANGTTTGQGQPMPESEASTCAKDNQQVVTQSKATVKLTKVSLVGVGFPKYKKNGKMVSFGEGSDLPHV